MPDGTTRRRFLRWTTAGVLLAGTGCSKPSPSTSPSPQAAPVDEPSSPGLVRVLSVRTAVEGNVLPELIADFERQSSLRVVLAATDDPYEHARAGAVDLAISHYGHKHAEQFVIDGLGEWPRTLFSNQMALLGPRSDPAKIRGLDDAGEAFRRIAATKSPFVMNDIDGVRYLTEILWHAAGKPDRAGWLLDDRRHRKEDAIELAAAKRAYVFWGLTPFLKVGTAADFPLEPLVLGDPLLQRMLVSIVVKRSKAAGVNTEGAKALETHLLSPATQAKIREVRYPGAARVAWIPGGRHNRTAFLPKG